MNTTLDLITFYIVHVLLPLITIAWVCTVCYTRVYYLHLQEVPTPKVKITIFRVGTLVYQRGEYIT